MRDIKRKGKTHKDSNCVIITIICHGNRRGELLDNDLDIGWGLEDFVAGLIAMETLLNKSNVVLFQCVFHVP